MQSQDGIASRISNAVDNYFSKHNVSRGIYGGIKDEDLLLDEDKLASKLRDYANSLTYMATIVYTREGVVAEFNLDKHSNL